MEDVSPHLAHDMFPMSQGDLAPEAWRLESKGTLSCWTNKALGHASWRVCERALLSRDFDRP